MTLIQTQTINLRTRGDPLSQRETKYSVNQM